jgi:uncharacterized protein YcnI
MNRRSLVAAIAATAALTSTATAAQAHVTLQPNEAPAGGFARLDVRVPNEDDSKATTKVVVQMPPGFAEASYEPVPGWRVAVAKRKLATPVKTDEGDTLTEEVGKLTFTATGKGIAPGQFQDFGLSVGLPDKPAGTKLTFKALQTYAGGTVVRWIGAPGSEHPAPEVTLDAADAPAGATGVAPAAASDEKDGDGDGNGLAIVALVVGALGLLAGGAALVRGRG